MDYCRTIDSRISEFIACAIRMLLAGSSVSEIRIQLGHADLQSTTIYLNLNLARKKKIQKQLLAYTQAMLAHDPKLDALIDWENKTEILTWLDSL